MYSSHLIIDMTTLPPGARVELEAALYGTAFTAPRLPMPDEIFDISELRALSDRDNDGEFDIRYDAVYEDPEDPGTFVIYKPGIREDENDPGTYLIGVGA